MMWMQLRIINLLLCLVVGHVAVARIMTSQLPQNFTPRLMIIASDTLLSKAQESEQVLNSEYGLQDSDISEIESLISDIHDLQDSNMDVEDLQRNALLWGKYHHSPLGNGDTPPYVQLASWHYPAIACILAASVAITPWVVLGKDRMKDLYIVRLPADLAAGSLLLLPRMKIRKQLQNGEIDLNSSVFNNKSLLKNMSAILAGTCFILMEAVILIFEESDQT